MASDYFKTRYNFDPGRDKVWKAICEYINKYISVDSTVLDLGSGYCNFINNITAKNKIAIDSDNGSAAYCNSDVNFICSKTTEIAIRDNTLDVVFASNLFEHLDDEQLLVTSEKIYAALRPGGKLILLQPNYYFAFREYWDDYTHRKAFSHVSICDFLGSQKLKPIKVCKRFLPYSFKSPMPKSYWLTKFYLYFPWHPFAKQMLVIAEK